MTLLSCCLCFFLWFQVLCTLIAAFLHFFFLSSFCWVLTEAWQSYMAVTGRLRNRIIRKRFLCLGWGGPSSLLSVMMSGCFFLYPFYVKVHFYFLPQVSLHWLWQSQWDSPKLKAMEHQASKDAFLQIPFCVYPPS